jgi:hypothetical protein
MHDSIQYYVDKVQLNGFGARPIEYTIIRQEVQKRAIDLQFRFKAINFGKLNKNGKRALRGVYRFFAKGFQPPIRQSDFEFMEYKTKGEWLAAYMRYLVNHTTVSSQARHDIS